MCPCQRLRPAAASRSGATRGLGEPVGAAGGDVLHSTPPDPRAIARAEGVGAEIDVIAMAAVRATREAMVRHEGEKLAAPKGHVSEVAPQSAVHRIPVRPVEGE